MCRLVAFIINIFIITDDQQAYFKVLRCGSQSVCFNFMRGYRTMTVRNFNGRMVTHCSRMRLVSGEPIQKMKRVEMDENPLCS